MTGVCYPSVSMANDIASIVPPSCPSHYANSSFIQKIVLIKTTPSPFLSSNKGLERQVAHAKAIGFCFYQNLSDNQILTDVEKDIINIYTRNQSFFTDYLKQNIPLDSSLNRNAMALDKVLSKLPNSVEVTFRGLSCAEDIYGKKIQPGCLIYNNSFMSTSLSKKCASTFLSEKKGERVFFEIYGRSGKNISMYSRLQGQKGEAEYLFRPGILFNVLTVARKKGVAYVTLREVQEGHGMKIKHLFSGEEVTLPSAPLRQAPEGGI